MAKNHEISVYFSTNVILASCHTLPYSVTPKIPNGLVCKQRTILSWNDVNRYKFSNSYAWWGWNLYRGSLVLDLRIWWRHVHTLLITHYYLSIFCCVPVMFVLLQFLFWSKYWNQYIDWYIAWNIDTRSIYWLSICFLLVEYWLMCQLIYRLSNFYIE